MKEKARVADLEKLRNFFANFSENPIPHKEIYGYIESLSELSQTP